MADNGGYMTSALVQKLTGVRDLTRILETTVKDLGEAFRAETCQIMLTNPLDPNVTSICEFRAEKEGPPEVLPTMNMPLVLQGRTVGSLSLARYQVVSQDEINTIRVILGELSDLIRHAQIDDIVTRDTFRDTFLMEIGNVMAYSLGIGDALFMVVNILGKVLKASRCLFICTDDTQAGWKCYEFWQQDKVQSCQDYRWPTSASPLIAQTLLSTAPMKVYEGQVNSYVSPVQDELQFIGVKSLLGVALRSTEATHGCVILQQCDYRRAWTRNEIDMVQNV
ncbi:MAG: GAF domain-containing protein, partial [Terriglobales bacterium]